MRRFARKHGVHVQGFSEESMGILTSHRWPGNVRELQNVVERAVILCGDNGMLEQEHLGLAKSPSRVGDHSPSTETSDADGAFPTMAELEKRHILAALQRCKENRTHAAKMLGLSIRTLRNKLHEYKEGLSGDVEAETVESRSRR
jgi:DNA-binding NtrC family response regulator